MKRVLSAVILVMLILSGCAAQSQSERSTEAFSESTEGKSSTVMNETETETETETEMKNDMSTEQIIKVTVGSKTFTATLENNASAKELVERMPFTVNMQELNGNEKYYQFPDSFPSDPSSFDTIKAGDLMLYQSDYLVVFYEDHTTTYDYTRLGVIDNADGLAEALGSGSAQVTFEAAE